MRPSLKFAVCFAASMFAGLFFMTWAMQTVWQASFPQQGSAQAGVHFYLQFGAGVFSLVAAVVFAFKWYRSLRSRN